MQEHLGHPRLSLKKILNREVSLSMQASCEEQLGSSMNIPASNLLARPPPHALPNVAAKLNFAPESSHHADLLRKLYQALWLSIAVHALDSPVCLLTHLMLQRVNWQAKAPTQSARREPACGRAYTSTSIQHLKQHKHI